MPIQPLPGITKLSFSVLKMDTSKKKQLHSTRLLTQNYWALWEMEPPDNSTASLREILKRTILFQKLPPSGWNTIDRYSNSADTSKNQSLRTLTKIIESDTAPSSIISRMIPFTLLSQELRTPEFHRASSWRGINCHSLMMSLSTTHGRIWTSLAILMYTREFSELLAAMNSPGNSTKTKDAHWTHQKIFQETISVIPEQWLTINKPHQTRLRSRNTLKSCLRVDVLIRTLKASLTTTGKFSASMSSGRINHMTVVTNITFSTTISLTAKLRSKKSIPKTLDVHHSQCSLKNRSSQRPQSLLTAQVWASRMRLTTVHLTSCAEMPLSSMEELALFMTAMNSLRTGTKTTWD